jgi:ABC-type nitrate/sulfonate/bicarbonate transport system substrate-binding protein
MINVLRATAILGGLALAGAFHCGEASAQEAAPVTIKVGTSYPGTETMPIYVAREQGYFREERLSVDLISLATGDKIAFAILGGSIEIARYTPDWIIRAIEKGGSKLKIVLGSSNSLIFSLVASNEVKSYSDLKGKRIGVSTIAAADASLVIKMLAARGLSKGEYSLIQAGSSPERAAALRAGSLAATLLTPPIDQRIIDEGGFHRLDRSTDVIKRYAWGAEAVREDWARANRATLVAYMRAWIKASRWQRDPANKEEVIRILAREAKVDDHYARGMYDLYYGPGSIAPGKDGELDLVGYQALLADMVERGQLESPTPAPEKFVDSTYWDEARKTLP